ncbi:MAG: hypothetical protein U1F63_07315 [Chitinivorax sp.]
MVETEEVQSSEQWAQQIARALHLEGLLKAEDAQQAIEVIAGLIDMRILLDAY